MTRPARVSRLLFLIVLTLLSPGSPVAVLKGSAFSPGGTGAAHQRVRDAYGKLPLAFVPNVGQTDSTVRYSAQVAGAGFYFTPKEAVFAFRKGGAGQTGGVLLRLAFLDANPETTIEAQRLGTGKVNYLIGGDPSQWRTGLPTYGQVVYRDLWPGIDMVFRGDASRLKYEFVLRPGARVEDIHLAYRGADQLSLETSGQLLIRTVLGTLKDERPLSYQELARTRVPVESRFLLRPNAGNATAYGFAVGDYDVTQPLVIDPGLAYSTFLGGTSMDQGNPIAVDANGNAYLTGETASTNASFPDTPGAFDTVYNGGARDAFVAKLNATGSALVYATYLGGSGDDRGLGIAIDTAVPPNAYVTGETSSRSDTGTIFPTTLGAFDTIKTDGNVDAFVTKLNGAGSALVYSTYLGGINEDRGRSIAIDTAVPVPNAYITGETRSGGLTPFPVTLGAFDTTQASASTFDVFVTKLNGTGTGLVYSTLLGGSGSDSGRGIALDLAVPPNAYITGDTNSNPGGVGPPPGAGTFPLLGAFDTTRSGVEAFVTKLNGTGTALLYSSYLGGNSEDIGYGIAVDTLGNAYATGETGSDTNFPTTMGAFDTSHNDAVDAFVAKINPTGSALVYSTYLGGDSSDRGLGIGIDKAGNAYVTGDTNSLSTATPFPTTVGAFDISSNGNFDAFVTKLDPTGSALVYSTYLGGNAEDRGFGIAVDTAANAYVTGLTRSDGPTSFPTTVGAFDTDNAGGGDAFVTKLDATAGPPATLTLSPPTDRTPSGPATP